ncbi:type I-B CRISPR-associated endonuclease Cas1b [Aneurinibacillus tyrosinisolvens]|uniref:type I-B CRISPR-associated endonuclease Cas1b n=1 Tax=Aneurinibacillus tyrosinisolvens TaxID=1443435 RepID=UPI00063F803A|nr:type I-B CRISPR-associated endonuclease Cas1b [Aneurinibacillus tyrosinisolvens]
MLKDYYIFSNGRMKRKDNTFFFVDHEEKKKSLPVERIDNIYVFGEVDLNSSFLNLMNQHDVRVHFFNYYGFYSGTFYPRSKKISGFTVVQQSAHYLDLDKRLFIAKSFVQSASFHMLRNLRHYKEKVQEHIDSILTYTKLIDKTVKVQELMGVEGMIRQTYYESLNQFLPEEFAFDKRSKRPPNDPLNALISFGNSLCYTAVLSEIYKTHLDPTISFLHEPSSKRFSLSLDLAEIFKPLLVDTVIFTVLNKKVINKRDFDYLENMVVLNEQGRKKFVQEWDKKLATTVKHRKLARNVSYRYFIRLECYKLIKHFVGDTPYKPLKAWW